MKLADIIKYEGDNSTFIWKHPVEDFNLGTQLIVHESQEALLFRNGQALDLFGPGRYTIDTENIPLLSGLINVPLGGQTPFHCEIYFINKVDCMDILWGTASPIPIQDPIYEIILPVRANGQFALQVCDSRKLLLKLVGTANGIGKDAITVYFRGLLMTKIKDYLSTLMVEQKISFLHIHSYLDEISEQIKNEISQFFLDYGVKIVNFFVSSVTVPSDDPGYIKIKNALATAKEKELLAKGKRAEMEIVGYDYQQERTFNVLEKAAQNEGTGANIMGVGMGVGMGVPLGGIVGKTMGDAMEQLSTPSLAMQTCSHCRAKLPENAKFCLQCGHKVLQEDQTVCPKCGETTPKGKFCMNCGTALSASCPNCGTPVPAGAKFCMNCGKQF